MSLDDLNSCSFRMHRKTPMNSRLKPRFFHCADTDTFGLLSATLESPCCKDFDSLSSGHGNNSMALFWNRTPYQGNHNEL